MITGSTRQLTSSRRRMIPHIVGSRLMTIRCATVAPSLRRSSPRAPEQFKHTLEAVDPRNGGRRMRPASAEGHQGLQFLGATAMARSHLARSASAAQPLLLGAQLLRVGAHLLREL